MKSSKSVIMAVVIAVSVILWMLTGIIGRSNEIPEDEQAHHAEYTTPRVAVQISQARPITRHIIASGQTQPNRIVELRAETDGRIIELGVQRGAQVRAGDRIARLDIRDREARRVRAQALVAQRELELQAARKLKESQYVSETQLAEGYARVVSAQAELKEIQIEIAQTELTAPFDAVMQERAVELGDYVNSGDTIAEMVDIDPLIVAGDINERDVNRIEVGGPGFARFVNGETLEGTVRYIASVANENTRTFRVELAIPNPEGMLRAGLTAELNLAGERTIVHSLSSALLTLGDDGEIGVKTVDDNDIVQFYPVEIVDAGLSGLSVSGLPNEVRLIVVGQGFVRPGDQVIPVVNPTPVGFSNAQSAEPQPSSGQSTGPQG